jgi:ActR/RegA family two-component response regulator
MMNDKPQVLVIEDDAETLADYLLNLRSDEYHLTGACSLEEAIAALEQQAFDVVVTDLELFNRPDGGMLIIERAKALDATIGAIMVTGVGGVADANHAIRELGARGFFRKPLDFAACRRRMHQAIMERRYRLAAIEAADQGGFVPMRNPYVAGKSLSRGSTMFYGRDQVFDFVRDNIGEPPRHNHLALIGPRRIGKTSILQQLPERLEPSYFLPVYINCQSFGIDPGMPAFFLHLSRRIHRSLQEQGVDVSSLPVLDETDLVSIPTLTFTDTFLPRLLQVLEDRSLVLCLDEFEELENKVQRGRLDVAVFECLRELMQTEGQIICILAGTRRLEELGAMSQVATSILDMVVYRRIGVLPPELARRLIEEPVEYSGMYYLEEAIERLQRATGGHPYLIQLLCGVLVNRRNEQRRNEMTLDDVNAAIAAVVEGPEPGFFWKTLTSHQQVVLIAACWLAPNGEPVTSHDIEAQLGAFSLSYQGWPTSVIRLLDELALQELLRKRIVGGWTPQYTLAFDLLSAWVRRHKAIDQIREDIEHDQ